MNRNFFIVRVDEVIVAAYVDNHDPNDKGLNQDITEWVRKYPNVEYITTDKPIVIGGKLNG